MKYTTSFSTSFSDIVEVVKMINSSSQMILSLDDHERITADIEKTLEKFAGKTKLHKLHGYYFTWKLPKHPQNETLYALVVKLSDIRTHLRNQVANQLYRCQTDQPASATCHLHDMEKLFRMTVTSEWDQQILEHCKMHYFMMKMLVCTMRS